jgi:hypothetical protein
MKFWTLKVDGHTYKIYLFKSFSPLTKIVNVTVVQNFDIMIAQMLSHLM